MTAKDYEDTRTAGDPPGTASAQREWQPIATCPDSVTEALLFWPALKLDEDGNLTNKVAGPGLVGRATRPTGDNAWDSNEPELESNGAYFDDDWEYGNPTHWMPLPDPPAEVSR